MRNAHFRVSPIELKRMTGLAIGGKTDPLIKATVRLELVTIIAIEFLSVHRRDVGRQVTLVIETKQVGIARVNTFQLKFGMRFPKRSERRGKTLRRSRQLEDDLLRRVRMPMKSIARNAYAFLGRSRHGGGIVVASRALRTRDQSE